MDNTVTPEQIKIARGADLFGYLLENHDNEIIKEGTTCLRLADDRSVCTREGFCGYKDFSTDETGNAVDCLVKYFDYTFQGAVIDLCQYMGYDASDQSAGGTAATIQKPAGPDIKPEKKQFVLPEPVNGLPRHLYAYLTQTRKIPEDVVKYLLSEGVMYQEREHNNIVFVNPERTFAEIRGTNTCKSFHRVMLSEPDGFWWFKYNGIKTNPTIAFVCEAAIDAVSLYCIHRILPNWTENSLYCSIAGVANQKRIDRIKAGMGVAGLRTVIAVDNDAAGEQCRQRNMDCDMAIPCLKDWNDVWRQRRMDLGI